MNVVLRSVCCGWALLMLVACAGRPASSLSPSGDTSGQRIAVLQKQLEEARAEQLNLLAPGSYEKAHAAYQKATLALEKGEKQTVIHSYVSEGQRQLHSAAQTGQLAQAILAGIRDARQKAFDAGAQELGVPFRETEVLYVKVTQAVENDNLRYAQENAAKLTKAYNDLEIRAIKGRALGPARNLMQKAGEDGIEKIVPRTFQEAQIALARADTEIGQNPYNLKLIQANATQALFMAQRAMALAAMCRQFQQLNAESSALYVENQMARLSQAMQSGDLRNITFEEQVTALGGSADKMRKENQSLTDMNYAYQRQITAMEERISGLKGFASQQEASMERLEQVRAFNQRFEQIQKSFSASEAEVHRQGDQLVVRLRGIQFPVGTAILPEGSFMLLAKVLQAIQVFGQAKVLIEGHTDNTGSAAKNQSLSRERAEAVRAYLIAGSTLPADRIQAIGHGADRPIAANDSAQGRAMNRRIDVRITPDHQP